MVAAVGRGPALGYMMGKAVGSSSWRRMGRALQLAVAVVFARER